MGIRQVGNILPTKTRDNPNQGRVYLPSGIAPTIGCNAWENSEGMHGICADLGNPTGWNMWEFNNS